MTERREIGDILHGNYKRKYEYWIDHSRPLSPYYVKCLSCGEIYEKDHLENANAECRYHAGYHGGWKEEEAEIAVTDATGRELFRHHAIHTPDMKPPTCPECNHPLTDDSVSCNNCGFIPEEVRA